MAQHRPRAEDMPKNSEASPPALASKIITPQQLSYNKSVIDFDTIPSEPINTADGDCLEEMREPTQDVDFSSCYYWSLRAIE